MGNPQINNKREFYHSISRITDRLGQIEKDADRITQDIEHQKFDIKSLKEDIGKVRTALESLFNDLLKEQRKGNGDDRNN